MQTYNNLYQDLCSYENLELAFKKARKHKTLKPYIVEFEKNLQENLQTLRTELLLYSYRPHPLKTFIIHDPKIRKISKSEFRDRIVHHALVNVIEPIFDKSFIYDSYANRKTKGTLKALQRFDFFKRKISKNNTKFCYVLKADVKHYFDTVNHEILISIIKRKIKDKTGIWLIRQILSNFNTEVKGKGMPLGNLTSQFFANVYLNELDYFVKHDLKVKYYLRYVDDFIITDSNKEKLQYYQDQINEFLKPIKLELHPDKSKIIRLDQGIGLLGFRVFYYHKLLKKSNIRKIQRKLLKSKEYFDNGLIEYDEIYASFEGWLSYSKHGSTYKLRTELIKNFEETFKHEISNIEINRYLKHFKSHQPNL